MFKSVPPSDINSNSSHYQYSHTTKNMTSNEDDPSLNLNTNNISEDDGENQLISPSTNNLPSKSTNPNLNVQQPLNFATTDNNNNDDDDTTPRTTSNETEDLYQQRILLKEQRLEDIKNQCSKLISELDSNSNPEAIVKKHISQLKKYNELKDIALGLVTMIADQRQLRTTDILEEMKVELRDD